MKKKTFTTTALVCCFMICLAAIADLNGKWIGTVKTPDGTELPVTYIFKADGDKLTGTAQAQGEPAAINDGKITGNDFTFNVTNGDGSILQHSGKYYADSVSMNIEINGSKIHFTLKRADK